MAVNLKDDYEKLAKLLYPSIEASGNVYYGTTRKLTMDALLDKTDIGFESCTANNRFEWKLGPLHSFVRISSIEDNIVNADTFGGYHIYRIYQDGSVDSEPITGTDPIYGTFFAKYILAVDTSNAVSNLTNVGDFTTYEYNVRLIPAVNGNVHGIYVTDDFDPANPTGYDIYDIQDRHFFITKEEGQIVLYVKVAHCEESESDYKSQPITFTHKRLGNITSSTVTLNCHGDYGDSYQCQYRQLSQVGGNFIWSNWQNYTISTPITLYSNDEQVQFRSNGDAPQQFDSRDYLYFTTSGRLEVSGNIMSLLDDCFNDVPAHYSITWYKNGLPWLFSECVDIISAENLILPSELEATASYLYTGSYYGMFNGCTSLRLPPKVLPATVLTNNIGAYGYMFFNCTRLVKAPRILAAHLSESCFIHMFSGCTSLADGGDILPATSLADHCYHSMFYNCQSLERSPKLPATTLGNAEYAYASMFLSCSSLASVYCNLVDSSSTVSIGEQNFLLYTASNGTLYINSKSDWTLSQVLPSGWSLQNNPCDETTETVGDYINFIPDYNTRFTVDARNAFNESNYLVITGFDSELNGRGYLTDDTLYNMEQFFDENNTHYTNEYNQDGSYNQEIWGYKSFNSPVQFRNGLYGESSLIAADPGFNPFTYLDNNNSPVNAGVYYKRGSKLQNKLLDTDRLESQLEDMSIQPVSGLMQYNSISKTYSVTGYSNHSDCITENSIYSVLHTTPPTRIVTGDRLQTATTCAAIRTCAKTYISYDSGSRSLVQRYTCNASSGKSYIAISSDYDSDGNYLDDKSSVKIILDDNSEDNSAQSYTRFNGISLSCVDDDTKKINGKSSVIANGYFHNNTDVWYDRLDTGTVIESARGNLDFIDTPCIINYICLTSKSHGASNRDSANASLEISSMSATPDAETDIALGGATLRSSTTDVSNNRAWEHEVQLGHNGGTGLKISSHIRDTTDNSISESSEFKVRPDGCSIDEVPIVPPIRSFTGSPIFTKGSVHILVVTNFNQLLKIGCGSIISSGTYQGDRCWHVGDHTLPGTIIALGRLCIGATGTTSVEIISPGYPNESMQFKVLNCRNASDTDKSLIVISMTDDSLA